VREVRRLCSLFHGLDDSLASKNARIDDMRPLRDAQSSSMILLLHSVPNVDKLSIFEEQEVMFGRKLLQALDGRLAEVGYKIDVGFEDGYMGAEL
jgi:hypothetical protein